MMLLGRDQDATLLVMLVSGNPANRQMMLLCYACFCALGKEGPGEDQGDQGCG